MTMKTRFHALKVRGAWGLTLVEILVGVGVLAILLAVAAPSMADLLERRRVIAAAEEIAGILSYAKAETVATNSLLFVRFDPDPSNKMSCAAVVTEGSLDTCRCYRPANDICPAPTDARSLRLFQLPLDHVKFSAAATAWAGGSANRIKFIKEQMNLATEGFHVDVVGLRKGYALQVDVSIAGRIKICSPHGDMGGYPQCA